MRRKTAINPMTGELFEPYSIEDTIIVYGLDDWQTDKIRDIAQRIKARVLEADVWQDMLAYPAFYTVINPARIEPDVLETLLDVWADWEDDSAILFIHETDAVIPKRLQSKISVAPSVFADEQLLKLKLLNQKTRTERLRDNALKYDVKIFRILYILKKLKQVTYVSSASMAQEFSVTARTVQRDIDMLRRLGEIIEYDAKKRAYYLLDGESAVWRD